MNVEDYANKYRGAPAELLRDLAHIKGSHPINHDYQRSAATALTRFGISRSDAYEIARTLTAEQVRRLGEHVAALEDQEESKE